MDNATHIGHVGAMTVAISAAVMVAATAAPAPVSPAVKLSASSAPCTPADVTCALIMGFTSLPTPDDAYIDAVKNQFIAPTHPGQHIEYVAVTTPEEGWPVTGLIRLGCAAVGAPSLCGPGGAAWPDEPWWNLSGLFDLTYNQSKKVGLVDLEAAMAAHPDRDLVIYGYSQGATIATLEKQRLAAQYPAGTKAPNVDFVLGGDLNLPNGGLEARFPGLNIPILDWSFDGPDLTDTQFDTTVITRQYDGAADFPLYPIDFISDLNAILGYFYVHLNGFEVSLPPDPTKTSPAYQGHYGDTDYYFFETNDLPLFGPLRTLGVPEPLIDVVEPFVREIVELGYDRSIPPWEPTPARLIPTLDPGKVTTDLVNAVGEGITNAAALTGLPPLLKTPPPTALSAPATEAVESNAVQTDVAQHVTSKDPPTRTAELGSVEPATENEQGANVPSTATSEQVKQTSRRATPRPVVRDSLDATERPRAFPHRRNDSATATTETTADEPATTPDPTPASSTPAASDADNPSSDDTSGSDADNAA